MKYFRIFQNRSINSLLVLSIILFSSVITIFTTAVQLTMDYRRDVSLIQRHFEEIEISYIQSLNASLWVMDADQTRIMIEGISRLRDIQYIAVEKNGVTLFSTGTNKPHRIIKRKYALNRMYEGQRVELGELNVVATLDGVYHRLLNKVFVILFFNAVKTFSVALFFFYLFEHLIKRHLDKIADHTRRFSGVRPYTKLRLDRNRDPDFQQDELDHVVTAINEMQFNLEKSYKSITESEEKFRQVVQTATDAIISMNEQGNIITWNTSAEKMFGRSEKEALGMSVLEIVPKKYLADHKRVISEFDADNFHAILENTKEVESRDKNGRIFPMEISLAAWETDSQKRFTAIIRDITDRKKLEAQLQQSQKMESIGTLAGGVAHEINNPINGIMNYAQLIMDKTDPENALQEYAAQIIHEAERTAGIVKNLLTFAREEKESHSPARLEDIINAVLSLVQTIIRKDQIQIEMTLPKDLPKIKCRSQQIQQVFMNLMTNARDALNEKYPGYHENKKIIIGAELYEKEGRRWICTTVQDHGSGIAPEIKDKIFDPFFTSKSRNRGTGLGLSISYGIVNDHDGQLTFDTQPGQLTKFHMDLPVDN